MFFVVRESLCPSHRHQLQVVEPSLDQVARRAVQPPAPLRRRRTPPRVVFSTRPTGSLRRRLARHTHRARQAHRTYTAYSRPQTARRRWDRRDWRTERPWGERYLFDHSGHPSPPRRKRGRPQDVCPVGRRPLSRFQMKHLATYRLAPMVYPTSGVVSSATRLAETCPVGASGIQMNTEVCHGGQSRSSRGLRPLR